MANSNREFRKIPSLDFLYEVSEDGRSFRNVKSKKESKIIVDHHHSEKGYHHTFVNIKGHVQRVPIARVVAETFIGPKPEGMEIDHKDRDSLNDDYHNLRYVTKSEQMKNRTLPEEFLNRVTKNLNGKLSVKTKITRIKDKNYSSVSNQGTNDLIEEKLFQSMNACSKFLVNYSTDNVRTIYHKISKLQKGKIKRLIIGPYEIKIN
jgi:hypothetical protein